MGYVTNWKGISDDDPGDFDISSDDGPPAGTVVTATSQESTPAGGWASVSGICKATDGNMLAAMKELQRQINRVMTAAGGAKVTIDGAIGNQTVAAMTTLKAMPSAGAYNLANIAVDCASLANNILAITINVQAMGDYLGASSSVSSPSPSSTPTIYDPTTSTIVPQPLTASAADAANNLSTPMKLAALALAGGIGYMLWKGKR